MKNNNLTNSKRKQKKPMGVVGASILTVLFACILIIYVFYDRKALFGQSTDIVDVVNDKGEVENDDFVSFEAQLCFGEYGETKYKINGFIPAGKKKHYIVYAEGYGYLSVAAKSKKMKEKLDDLTKQTENFFLTGVPTEPITLKGKKANMAIDQMNAYKSSTNQVASLLGNISDVNLTEVDTSKGTLNSWLNFGILSLLEAIFIVSLVRTLKRKKQEKEQNVNPVVAGDAYMNTSMYNDTVYAETNPVEVNQTDVNSSLQTDTQTDYNSQQ